ATSTRRAETCSAVVVHHRIPAASSPNVPRHATDKATARIPHAIQATILTLAEVPSLTPSEVPWLTPAEVPWLALPECPWLALGSWPSRARFARPVRRVT